MDRRIDIGSEAERGSWAVGCSSSTTAEAVDPDMVVGQGTIDERLTGVDRMTIGVGSWHTASMIDPAKSASSCSSTQHWYTYRLVSLTSIVRSEYRLFILVLVRTWVRDQALDETPPLRSGPSVLSPSFRLGVI